jgi:hypothetical protein
MPAPIAQLRAGEARTDVEGDECEGSLQKSLEGGLDAGRQDAGRVGPQKHATENAPSYPGHAHPLSAGEIEITQRIEKELRAYEPVRSHDGPAA